MNVTSEVIPFTIQETDVLNFLIQFAAESNYSVAVWQLPEKRSKLILLAKRTISIDRDSLLEDLESGFAFQM